MTDFTAPTELFLHIDGDYAGQLCSQERLDVPQASPVYWCDPKTGNVTADVFHAGRDSETTDPWDYEIDTGITFHRGQLTELVRLPDRHRHALEADGVIVVRGTEVRTAAEALDLYR